VEYRAGMGAVFEALRRERIGTQIRDRRSNEEDGLQTQRETRTYSWTAPKARTGTS
jgi:hypothetical protein